MSRVDPAHAVDPDTRLIRPPHYAQIVADLIDEPYQLRPWEIVRLTDRQIFEYYYRPRDPETGAAKPLPVDNSTLVEETPEQIKARWFTIGRALISANKAGFTEEDLRRKWDEYQATRGTE